MYAAISIVNLLLPLFDGIAYAIVSPFLIPLNTSVNTGNGYDKPFANSFSPLSKKFTSPSLKTADLNFCVTLTCSIVSSISSGDILSYRV